MSINDYLYSRLLELGFKTPKVGYYYYAPVKDKYYAMDFILYRQSVKVRFFIEYQKLYSMEVPKRCLVDYRKHDMDPVSELINDLIQTIGN